MKEFTYHAFNDNEDGSSLNSCNIESADAPLILNCAGNLSTDYPFTTENPDGRRDYYLMVLVSGSLLVRFPDGERTVGAGTVILFPPSYPYYYRYSAEDGKALHYLWAHFTGSHALSLLTELSLAPLPYSRSVAESGEIAEGFERIFDVFTKNEAFRSHALSCALESVLIAVAKAVTKEASPKNSLSRSLSLIHTSYATDLRILELARMENLSVSRYSTLFHALTGTSPIRYLTSLRMSHACDLLRTTNLPIKQIGSLVGYDDPHFFSKIFKRHVGISPLQFRKGATQN